MSQRPKLLLIREDRIISGLEFKCPVTLNKIDKRRLPHIKLLLEKNKEIFKVR